MARLPPVSIPAQECGDLICLTVEATRDLAVWINEVVEYKRSVGLCPYVVTRD